jgi:hypothetical protein
MYNDIPRNESLRDNINAAKTLVIILIIFFVCWFPFFLTYILSFVGKVRIKIIIPKLSSAKLRLSYPYFLFDPVGMNEEMEFHSLDSSSLS